MSTVVERRRVVHRCPPVIHRLSTGFVPSPGDKPGTPAPRRPQNLQQEIHTLPQAVGSDVTVSTCPHLFAQASSTSVGNGEDRCPPLGITSCGRPVDNVGTTGLAAGEVWTERRRCGSHDSGTSGRVGPRLASAGRANCRLERRCQLMGGGRPQRRRGSAQRASRCQLLGIASTGGAAGHAVKPGGGQRPGVAMAWARREWTRRFPGAEWPVPGRSQVFCLMRLVSSAIWL